MGYFIVVIAQTVVLPLVSGSIQLATSGGDAILVYGKWWVFWAVGTRLLLAGLVQVSGKGPTAEILGSEEASVQEVQLTGSSAPPISGWAWPDALPCTRTGRCPLGLPVACSC